MQRFDSTCWSVVLGAAGGDTDDREEFGRRYAPVIRSYLNARWRTPGVADTVSEGVQEVLIECLRPAGALERIDRTRSKDFRAYLYGITRRTAIAMERRRRREMRDRTVGAMLLQCERKSATLSATFDRTWAQMLCVQALTLLRERLAPRPEGRFLLRCLEMRYLRGEPPRRISKAVGRTAPQVYEALKQAREEYRAALLEIMADYNPGASRRELEDKCRELAGDL